MNMIQDSQIKALMLVHEFEKSLGDLRRVVPVLVAASQPYMGTNTGKQIKVRFTENDKRVVEIKKLNKECLSGCSNYQ